MLNYTDILLAPIYTALGQVIAITLTDQTQINVVAIDKTAGIEVAEGSLDVMTVKPAAVVRADDLAELGYAPGDLRDAQFAMNGKNWEVQNWLARPSPAGEIDGEVYLVLQEI